MAGDETTLFYRRGGEAREADHVACRVDAGHIRAVVLVHRQAAVFVRLEAGSAPQITSRRPRFTASTGREKGVRLTHFLSQIKTDFHEYE
jgi:hypothetical protein